jgi:hypothetical protein
MIPLRLLVVVFPDKFCCQLKSSQAKKKLKMLKEQEEKDKA